MIRLSNEHWERIRKHFPEEHIPDGCPGRKPIPTRHSDVLRQVLTDVANELRDKGVPDEEESFIDTTFAMAKGGGAEVASRAYR
jgi:hypothetical protein